MGIWKEKNLILPRAGREGEDWEGFLKLMSDISLKALWKFSMVDGTELVKKKGEGRPQEFMT